MSYVGASLEAVASAAGYVMREWGEHGYAVERVEPGVTYGGVTLHIVHSDGSRFAVRSDRYGNAREVEEEL